MKSSPNPARNRLNNRSTSILVLNGLLGLAGSAALIDHAAAEPPPPTDVSWSLSSYGGLRFGTLPEDAHYEALSGSTLGMSSSGDRRYQTYFLQLPDLAPILLGSLTAEFRTVVNLTDSSISTMVSVDDLRAECNSVGAVDGVSDPFWSGSSFANGSAAASVRFPADTITGYFIDANCSAASPHGHATLNLSLPDRGELLLDSDASPAPQSLQFIGVAPAGSSIILTSESSWNQELSMFCDEGNLGAAESSGGGISASASIDRFEFAAMVVEYFDEWFGIWGRYLDTSDSWAEAFEDLNANNLTEIIALPHALQLDPILDLTVPGYMVEFLGDLDQPPNSVITLGDGVTLITAPDGSAMFNGDITVSSGALAHLIAPNATIGTTGVLTVNPFAVLNLHDAGLGNAGTVQLYGGAVESEGMFTNALGGRMLGFGHVISDLTNDGSLFVQADMQIIGDFVNNGETVVQSGTLTVIGSLTNNGSLVGDVGSIGANLKAATVAASGAGMAILGDYHSGSEASLAMPSEGMRLTVEGDIDIAIDDPARFDLADDELRLVGTINETQRLEVMSTDAGAAMPTANQESYFPIGTLRLSSPGATVMLVDDHDNDGLGQGSPEALYVDSLIIEAGATLITNGHTVYYRTLSLSGTVDDASRLVLMNGAGSPADVNGDGIVGIVDFLLVLATWGTCNGCPEDIDGDGFVGIEDFLAVLANWS